MRQLWVAAENRRTGVLLHPRSAQVGRIKLVDPCLSSAPLQARRPSRHPSVGGSYGSSGSKCCSRRGRRQPDRAAAWQNVAEALGDELPRMRWRSSVAPVCTR